MMWVTKDGRTIRVSEMNDDHLLYAKEWLERHPLKMTCHLDKHFAMMQEIKKRGLDKPIPIEGEEAA